MASVDLEDTCDGGYFLDRLLLERWRSTAPQRTEKVGRIPTAAAFPWRNQASEGDGLLFLFSKSRINDHHHPGYVELYAWKTVWPLQEAQCQDIWWRVHDFLGWHKYIYLLSNANALQQCRRCSRRGRDLPSTPRLIIRRHYG